MSELILKRAILYLYILDIFELCEPLLECRHVTRIAKLHASMRLLAFCTVRQFNVTFRDDRHVFATMSCQVFR